MQHLSLSMTVPRRSILFSLPKTPTLVAVAPLYLLTTDYTMIVVFFTLQGFFGGGGMHTQLPALSVRALPNRGILRWSWGGG
jgi:hypothetical protein